MTNLLLYQSLFHPRHHYVPKEEKPEDLQKEEEKKSYLKIGLIVGGVAIKYKPSLKKIIRKEIKKL